MSSITQLGLHPQPNDLEGAEPVYMAHDVTGNLHPPPDGMKPSFKNDGTRQKILRDWGQTREMHMHREPSWCMDQLVSGSGLYPPRHLTDEWFTEDELQMIPRLERQLHETNHGKVLAKDMMALKLYDIDINVVIDDSFSMNCSMFGRGEEVGSRWDRRHIQQVFGKRAFSPDSLGMFQNTGCRLVAGDSRWRFLVDAVQYWEPIFEIMQLRPKYYTLNQQSIFSSSRQALSKGPCGGTPSGATFLRVLSDIERQDPQHQNTHLIIYLTDGEASDAALFNSVLDSIQDGAYGDVQVLLMGLSLEPEDIKFFEDEECDDTRIRTIEAYEVEQQMILWRRVIQRPTDYNFAMHTVRALITNFFPGDYDYEAPIQTLRHRLYITLHAMDRRITGRRDNTYTDLTNCCAPLQMLLSGQQQTRGGGSVDSVEAELVGALCDPRFASLMNELRPPPQRAQQWGNYGRTAYRASFGGPVSKLQTAIGALQPSEMVNRDLQFSNVSANGSAVKRAVTLMCQAIGEPGLINPRVYAPLLPQNPEAIAQQPQSWQLTIALQPQGLEATQALTPSAPPQSQYPQAQTQPLAQPLLAGQQPTQNVAGSVAKGMMLGCVCSTALIVIFLIVSSMSS